MPFIAGAQPIDWFVHSALKHGRIEMGQGGDTQKDFTYVKDVVQGILLAYEKEEPTYRLYNLSSGKHILFRDVTNVIKKLLPDVSVNIGPGVLEVQGLQDISRARSDLDYEPQYDLEKGVKDYIQWLRPRTNMFPSPPPRVPKGAG
jgi:nucleoside-diphosphate-sugar epimerase